MDKILKYNSNIWFTSDTHYGHDNIILHSKRPFKDVEEMNEKLIENYNSKINKNDIVYHLGDFSYGRGLKNPEKHFKRLNGNKKLIKGNHDLGKVLKLPWESVSTYEEISVLKQRIVLMHYAMRVWHHSYRDVWMLYGHSHTTLAETDALSCDVGVDGWNYSPVSFEELKKKMEWKQHNPNYFSKLFENKNKNEISIDADFISANIKKTNAQFI